MLNVPEGNQLNAYNELIQDLNVVKSSSSCLIKYVKLAVAFTAYIYT